MMATIRDVAKRAGVSAMTVSRVLTGAAPVKDETRALIEAAIRELGYVPNAAARSLNSGRSNAVGLVVSPLGHPWWAQVAAAVQRYLSNKGIACLIADGGESEQTESDQLDLILRQGVDGVMLLPLLLDPAATVSIARQGLPAVVVSAPGDYGVDSVQIEVKRGVRELIHLLTERGHRRIGMLAGSPNRPLMYARYEGYLDALSEAAIADRALVRWLDAEADTRIPAAQAAKELLALPDPPTALFACAPDAGVGIIDALNEQRLRIPDDVSLVVFNEIPALHSFLTTALFPSPVEVGELAAEMLYERIEGYEGEPRRHALSTVLNARASVGPPPAASRAS